MSAEEKAAARLADRTINAQLDFHGEIVAQLADVDQHLMVCAVATSYTKLLCASLRAHRDETADADSLRTQVGVLRGLLVKCGVSDKDLSHVRSELYNCYSDDT